MPVYIYIQEFINIGEAKVLEAESEVSDYALVFEDDGDTGYLYGLDVARQNNQIVDAVLIYNVSNVSDKHLPSEMKMGWSEDGLKGLLMINNHPHAVFDFSAQRAYCRSNFPTPNSEWGQHDFGHEWDDSCLEFFK